MIVDPTNLFEIVLNVIDDKCRIGTDVGCLDKLFSHNQVEMCAESLLQEENAPDHVLGLHAVVPEESVGTAQGVIQLQL